MPVTNETFEAAMQQIQQQMQQMLDRTSTPPIPEEESVANHASVVNIEDGRTSSLPVSDEQSHYESSLTVHPPVELLMMRITSFRDVVANSL
jgi:hypothetical protein